MSLGSKGLVDVKFDTSDFYLIAKSNNYFMLRVEFIGVLNINIQGAWIETLKIAGELC